MSRSKVLLAAQQNGGLTFACTIWASEVIITVTLCSRWAAGALPVAPGWQFGGLFVLLASLFACSARYFFHQYASKQNRYNPWQTLAADLLTVVPPVVSGFCLLDLNSTFAVSLLVTISLVLFVATFFVSEAAHAKTITYLKIIAFGETALAELKAMEAAADAEAAIVDEPQAENANIDNALESRLEKLLNHAEPTPNREDSNGSTDQILQTMTRSLSATGSEIVSGKLQLPIAAGERGSIAHIPFEPAFCHQPEIICEANGMFSAQVTPAVIHKYGVRLEIRLNEPAVKAGVVDITYQATAPHCS